MQLISPDLFQCNQPQPLDLEAILKRAESSELTYPSPGCTQRKSCPEKGFHVDEDSIALGEGPETFKRAIAAMTAWRHFETGWTRVFPRTPELVEGSNLLVIVRHFGFHSINACRIVYRVEESEGETDRFGYGYGTLRQHAEAGEERFLIEWNRQTNRVIYHIFAFSRPNHILVSLSNKLARKLQDQFRVDSLRAMQQALSESA